LGNIHIEICAHYEALNDTGGSKNIWDIIQAASAGFDPADRARVSAYSQPLRGAGLVISKEGGHGG
jgi:hypothetical protein